MTLPLAIVERWPLDEYKVMYNDQCTALKQCGHDTVKLYHEIQLLRQLFKLQSDKESKRIDKNLDILIREKEERYFRLTKFNDYSAMIMASFPDSKFMTSYEYKRSKDIITDPILVRGISSGAYIKHAENNNRDFYFVETGYLGNYRSENNQTGRKIYHRIEKNAMQQRRFLDVPDDRWQALCRFNPGLNYQGWKKKPGSKILLIMSTEKPFDFYGHNKDEWVANTIAKIKEHSDRPIVIKDKPGRAERTTTANIYDALDEDVWALVTYNSIAAVEAIQIGIPAFALAPTAAAPVASADLSQIETPFKPDEDIIYKWLNSVAYGQFSIDEIITGHAWQLVQENEQRPTFAY